MLRAAHLITLSIALVLLVSGCVQQQTDTVKIGAVLPLTGSVSVYGEYARNGIDLALEDLNASGKKIEVVIEDSKGLPSEGVTAFHKLAADNGIKAIISMTSSVSVPLVPLAEEKKIPLIMTVVAASNVTDKSVWAYRYFHSADLEGPALAKLVITYLNVTKIAILYVNDEYGGSTYRAFKNTCESLGCTITAQETFLFADTDYRTQLLKIADSKPDAIFIVGFSQHLPTIYKQSKELGMEQTLITTSGMSVPAIINKTGSAAENSYLTVSYYSANPDDPGVKRFNDRYRSRFGTEPSYFAAYIYDSVMMIAESMKNGTSRENIKNSLAKISYSGLMGNASFLENRDANMPVFYAAIRNGTLVPIKQV
ncbi:MAG: ABC transporter substrate-binding protein [Candidatus Aenigmarchaeota archaeon]|nr:ABC transporter substrate-binding protein [Candidatus Aenigmarchaeota archaeon]